MTERENETICRASMLFAISLISISLITVFDRAVGHILRWVSDDYVSFAHARFPSFLLCLTILFALDRNALRFDFRKTNWKGVALASILWLSPAAYGVFVLNVWVPKIDGWIDITAFMITGLCAEEFLFRGSMYRLAQNTFHERRVMKLPFPVIYTSMFFSIQHLQYHSFSLTAAAQAQLVYTFVMGIFFGLVRHYGHSIWPVVGIHIINNLFTLVRNVSN